MAWTSGTPAVSPWRGLAERSPHRPVRFVHRATVVRARLRTTVRHGGDVAAAVHTHLRSPIAHARPEAEDRAVVPGRRDPGARPVLVDERRATVPGPTDAVCGRPRRWPRGLWERVGLPPQLPLRSRERKVTLDQTKVPPRRDNDRGRGTEGANLRRDRHGIRSLGSCPSRLSAPLSASHDRRRTA